ncbi:MAG: hypothetical protein WCI72_04525 [archaeon]
METKISQDIGEEIISKLKELNLILEKIMQEKKNAKECPHTFSCRNRIS